MTCHNCRREAADEPVCRECLEQAVGVLALSNDPEAKRLLALARRGLKAEREVCGRCAIRQKQCTRTTRDDGYCEHWRAKEGT